MPTVLRFTILRLPRSSSLCCPFPGHPGILLGAWLDIFAFDRRTLLARVAISVSLSIAVVPIAVYLCWLAVPAAPWLLCAASWVALPIVVPGVNGFRK